MSERTKLFLTILFRYAVVALFARLVDLGVFTRAEAEAFTPWLVEAAVTVAVPVFIAWLAHFAASQRFFQTQAAADLLPSQATPERIKDLAEELKKGR